MKKPVRRRPVKVNWVFAPKPEPPKMRTFKNGQSVIADIPHAPWAESDGADNILRVYCYGCKEYFKSYHHYLWRHGMCKEKPKKLARREKKNAKNAVKTRSIKRRA